MKQRIQTLINDAIKRNNEIEPLAKQLEFEEKVRQAKAELKNFIEEEINRIETKKHIFWRMLAIVSTSLLFIGLLASPVEIGLLVEGRVRESLIEPSIKTSLNKIIKDNASNYVDKQLTPFKQTVDSLRNQIFNLKDTIAEAESLSEHAQNVTGELQHQSASLSAQISDLTAILNVVQFIVAADHDNRPAFDVLLLLAHNSKSRFSPAASEVVVSIVTDTGFELNPVLQWDMLGVSNPDTLSLVDCKKIYSTQVRSDFKKEILQYVWSRTTYNSQ